MTAVVLWPGIDSDDFERISVSMMLPERIADAFDKFAESIETSLEHVPAGERVEMFLSYKQFPPFAAWKHVAESAEEFSCDLADIMYIASHPPGTLQGRPPFLSMMPAYEKLKEGVRAFCHRMLADLDAAEDALAQLEGAAMAVNRGEAVPGDRMKVTQKDRPADTAVDEQQANAVRVGNA